MTPQTRGVIFVLFFFLNSVREQCPCTVTQTVYNIVHCSSLVVCTLRSVTRTTRAVVPCRVRAAFYSALVAHHPKVYLDTRPTRLCRDLNRSVPALSLSRRSLSCRDARPTTLCHDREVPIATQTSLPA